jgi:Holliday junction resolvasome RuvABC endonuclease subunit
MERTKKPIGWHVPTKEDIKSLPKPFVVLTNDPSFTGWGWVVLDANSKILEAGAIQTKPDDKKLRIRKGDDTVRRTAEILKILLGVIKKHKVTYLVSELPHGSQNAQGAIMIGIVVGIAQSISDALEIPIEYYSEADAKGAIAGKDVVSKAKMIALIKELFEVPWTGVKYKDEAIADALAIYNVAIQQSPTLKLMKK